MRIGIVGAGIAGLTLAHLLTNKNVPTVVFERHDRSSRHSAGVGFSIQSAQHILSRLGFAAQIDNVITHFESIVRCTPAETLNAMKVNKFMDSQNMDFTYTPAGITSTDLIDILAESLPADSLKYNKYLVDIEETEEGVVAKFLDGTSEVVDLLIGADGPRSTVRQKLFGSTAPHYTGYSMWAGMSDYHPANPDTLTQIYWPSHMLGMFPMGKNCESFGFWFVHPQEEALPEEWVPELDTNKLLDDIYRDNPHLSYDVEQMLQKSYNLMRYGLYTHKVQARKQLYKGRVVLLGNAAFPTYPSLLHGADISVENALNLAVALGKYDLEEALDAYQRVSFDKSQPAATAIAQRLELEVFAGPILAHVRNMIWKLSGKWRWRRQSMEAHWLSGFQKTERLLNHYNLLPPLPLGFY